MSTARQARGISLVETVISMIIVGVMLSAALTAAGTARTQGVSVAHHTQAMLLAEQLMSEIQSRAYEDPDGSPVLGREGEDGATRSAFDDVDDYDGWIGEPPVDADGSIVNGGESYARFVEVDPVDPSALGTTRGSDSGVKRIRVGVSLGGRVIAELVAYRTTDGVPALSGDE